MSRKDQIRRNVSRAYAEAVTTGDGCCSTSCCGDSSEAADDKTPKGVAAKTAGYSQEELASLPAEAAVNSFGCGNPTAFAGVREGEVVVDVQLDSLTSDQASIHFLVIHGNLFHSL